MKINFAHTKNSVLYTNAIQKFKIDNNYQMLTRILEQFEADECEHTGITMMSIPQSLALLTASQCSKCNKLASTRCVLSWITTGMSYEQYKL
jgi:hypothetical protein